jgi:hypothetical protein
LYASIVRIESRTIMCHHRLTCVLKMLLPHREHSAAQAAVCDVAAILAAVVLLMCSAPYIYMHC